MDMKHSSACENQCAYTTLMSNFNVFFFGKSDDKNDILKPNVG